MKFKRKNKNKHKRPSSYTDKCINAGLQMTDDYKEGKLQNPDYYEVLFNIKGGNSNVNTGKKHDIHI